MASPVQFHSLAPAQGYHQPDIQVHPEADCWPVRIWAGNQVCNIVYFVIHEVIDR